MKHYFMSLTNVKKTVETFITVHVIHTRAILSLIQNSATFRINQIYESYVLLHHLILIFTFHTFNARRKTSKPRKQHGVLNLFASFYLC